jgi:hypothetical protein
MVLHYVFGFGFSIVVGLLIGLVTDAMRGGESGHGWKTKIQGSVEQVLYTSSVLIGQPVFVAVWLGVKTAGQWQTWTGVRDQQAFSDKYLSPYLIGNALSIIVAITGAKIVQWSATGHIFAGLAPAAVGFGILSLYFWPDYMSKKSKKDTEATIAPTPGEA